MKKLFFVMVLMLAFAIPSMADMTVPVSAGGGIGKYCIIASNATSLNLGAPSDVGWIATPISAVVTTNVNATIGVSITSACGDNTVCGPGGHSLTAWAYWGAPQDPPPAVAPSTQAVTPPKDAVTYDGTASVLRGGVGDPEGSYDSTIIWSITCS